jgi:cytochrome c551/c552
MDDLVQLLDCTQIHQIQLEVAGDSYSDIDEKLCSSRHILEQLEHKVGTKLQVTLTIS